ncbi:carbamoyltransferase C-terminal domain-containing protein [Dactylosporangium sp. NPDC051485]|uniref:carbamoyltransferase C-terminal domain-containing protein n=1 Tax=Dactylosporangium sp. NPDC051485 TaxID=3154846 RepID=UPI003432CF80
MWVLGINWKWHDSSAALVDETGKVWAFAEEERFTRSKHAWDTFPSRATQYCLSVAGITWQDIDTVAVGWDVAHLRDSEDALFSAIFDTDLPAADRPQLVFVKHHLAHAISSFYASGRERGGVLVVDGSGETNSATIYRADRATGLTPLRSWDRRFSLGSLYMAATQHLGFGRLDAGKTMGLSSHGMNDSSFILPIGDLLTESLGTSPVADTDPGQHFDVFTAAWAAHLDNQFGTIKTGTPDLHLDPIARQIAATAQRTVETVFRALHAETAALSGYETVCLAGGVALNCVANGMLPEPVYIPPFPHDAGVALGAAWSICPPRATGAPLSPYLGTQITLGDEIQMLREAGCTVSEFDAQAVAQALCAGKVGAVAQGRAEVGPRALGHRSIVALPRPATVQAKVNQLKDREGWRPFAPIALADYAPRLWPRQGTRSQYMIGTAVVSGAGREILPAAAHVDGTTRPQEVSATQDMHIAEVLKELERGGIPPVLINTSFNGRGEPIVNTAHDAARTFLTLGLDFLVLDDCLIKRPDN